MRTVQLATQATMNLLYGIMIDSPNPGYISLWIDNGVFMCLFTGFPTSPSEYASLAAQTVIGQVLEGVAPLPDDARVQALSITMTAFMEAWMEHILKHRIKFRYVLVIHHTLMSTTMLSTPN